MSDAITDQLQALVDALTSAGVPATLDPAEVNPPGAWVALDQLRLLTIGGQLQLTASVYLIAPDTTLMRALELLAPQLRLLLTVIAPDGPMVTQGVVLPADPTPLPAIRVPVNLKA